MTRCAIICTSEPLYCSLRPLGVQGPVNAVSFSRVVPLVDMEVPDYPVPPPPTSARGAIAKPSPSTPRSTRSTLSATSARAPPGSARSTSRRSAAGPAGGGAWGKGAVFASGGSDSQILLWRANFDRRSPSTASAGLKRDLRAPSELVAPGASERHENADEKRADEAPEPSAKSASQPVALSPLKGLENDSSFKSRTI